MQSSGEMYLEQMEAESYSNTEAVEAEYVQELQASRPQEIEILPGTILTLSKTNAEQFHQDMKAMIMQTGYGVFEYLEVIAFFNKLKDYISGDKQANIPQDKEFVSLVREEIAKHPKAKFTSARGVKFENAETGTAYDFSRCEDSELIELEGKAKEAADKVKARKDFLKTISTEGLTVVNEETGEASKIYPPSKSSNSSYKLTLPK